MPHKKPLPARATPFDTPSVGIPERAPNTSSSIKKAVDMLAHDYSDNIVQLKVGVDVHVTLNVHEKILGASSEFLQSALKKEWATSRPDPKVIDFSDDLIDVVRIYVHWLYTEQISPVENIVLARCYVFGEKIMDKKFQDVVIRIMTNKLILPSSIAPVADLIYQGTPPDSPIRRFIIDMFADSAQNNDGWKSAVELLDKEIMVDLMKAMLEVRRAPNLQSWRTYPGKYLKNGNGS